MRGKYIGHRLVTETKGGCIGHRLDPVMRIGQSLVTGRGTHFGHSLVIDFDVILLGQRLAIEINDQYYDHYFIAVCQIQYLVEACLTMEMRSAIWCCLWHTPHQSALIRYHIRSCLYWQDVCIVDIGKLW